MKTKNEDEDVRACPCYRRGFSRGYWTAASLFVGLLAADEFMTWINERRHSR